VYYADKTGKLTDEIQKNYFCLIDGIVGGEKNGPISCDPVYPGVLAAGFNPVAFDSVIASLMGFDIERIPIVKRAVATQSQAKPLFFRGLETVQVKVCGETLGITDFKAKYHLGFAPHPNWIGHVERPVEQKPVSEGVSVGA
ncbi:MAG TPA: DUF362 domain-containing protein, partial [Terriglobales bacterium]